MLSPSVFKPFENEGDFLIRQFAFDRYPTRVSLLSRERLHCGGRIDAARIRASLAPIRKSYEDFQRDSAYISSVASAYVSAYREARNRFSPYRQHFGRWSTPTDPIGDLLPASALRPRKDPPSAWDMRRLVEAMRWLVRAHRPRLERATALTMLRRGSPYGVDYLATKTTSCLENILYERNIPLWRHLLMGSEYCHVEKAVSPGRFRCSPDGQRLHMQHGMPGPRHWERTFTYWELARLAERVATWDAGWALGRAVELVEAEVYRIEGSFDGAEKRRSGMTMGRVPWLFDEKGDYVSPAPRAERSRTTAALEAW